MFAEPLGLRFSQNAWSSKKSSILDEWGACMKAQTVLKDNSQKITDFQKLQNSMDRITHELYSFESIRKAMLEHDNLFKQQVKELHRLYGVQKMLMNELKCKMMVAAPTQIRVTNVNSFKDKPGSFDLETHPKETQGETREIASKTSYNYDEEEAEIELTLSIGNPKNSKNKMKNNKHHHHHQRTHCDMDLVYNSSSITDHFKMKQLQNGLSTDQERIPSRNSSLEECSNNTAAASSDQRPHWLLQSLSSHKTYR